MVTQKAQRFRLTQLVITTVLLVSCDAVDANPSVTTPTLPPPILQVTHASDTATEIFLAPQPTAAPVPLSNPTIDDLALELFGDRLIENISIPAIRVDSPVTPVGWRVNFSEDFQSGGIEWDSPGPQVGWVITSALPDENGNILMYGHNNMFVEVFKRLGELNRGDIILLQTTESLWQYEVQQVYILPFVGAKEEQIAGYKKYLQPTQDSRLTLISCWPPATNTHRVVVIARPKASQ